MTFFIWRGGGAEKLLSMKPLNPIFRRLENVYGNLSYFLFKMFLYCGSILSYVVSCDISYVSLYQILQRFT